MNTLEFLSQLNDAEKEWGLWVDREETQQYHVGHYCYNNDRLPKGFVHVGSLNDLAHLRQKHILSHASRQKSEEALGREWAESFLSKTQW